MNKSRAAFQLLEHKFKPLLRQTCIFPSLRERTMDPAICNCAQYEIAEKYLLRQLAVGINKEKAGKKPFN